MFQGRVHNSDAAGVLTETLSYTKDGTHVSCSSNAVTWTATRDVQPPQTSALPPTGRYISGDGHTSFFVSTNRKHIGPIADDYVYLYCAPGGPTVVQFYLQTTPLKSDGSFSAKGKQQLHLRGGVIGTVNFTFRGHFHGVVGPSKAARAAGVLTETLTYTGEWCMATVPWVATLGGK